MDDLSTLLANLEPDVLAAFFHNMMSEPAGKNFLWSTLCVSTPEARTWLRNACEWSHETVTGARLPVAPPLPK